MQRAMVIGIIAFLLGLSIGAGLPDLDQRIFRVHRSIITHGFLLFIVWWSARASARRAVRFFAIGFAIASAVHFSFDLFPSSWYGYALIVVPTIGVTNSVFSWSWLAVCIVVGFYIALSQMRSFTDLAIGLVGFFLVFNLSAPRGQAVFSPLVAMLIAFAIACWLPSPIVAQVRRRFVH